jgi:ribonuclease P protein component
MPLAEARAENRLVRLRPGATRLCARSDFERVRREGRAWSHQLLVLVACPNELGVTRVGVAAGRKLGNAVIRNRAKRLLREAVRQHASKLASGWDLILIARAAIIPVKLAQVADALGSLMRQAGLVS